LTPKALPPCVVIGDHQKKKSMMDWLGVLFAAPNDAERHGSPRFLDL
jgi:hypothetical protein